MRHEHPYFIKWADNTINHPTGYTMWNGWGSVAHNNGPMFRYILESAAARKEKTIVISSCSDDLFPIPDSIVEQAEREGAALIAPVLCSFGPHVSREYVYIPASDDFFAHNMHDQFAPFRIPWERKTNLAVWRGGLSGEMLRINTVKRCVNMPYTDVKLIDNWPRPEYNPQKTPELFAGRIEAKDQCRYKAVFWIDGNCIPSNVLWVFATGSVPIIINETCYWFKNKIKPWVHYVPVNPDLSDLEKNVRWIFENDGEARKIAENALEFARTELTPERQRAHIDSEIDRRIRESREPPKKQPAPIETLSMLVSFSGGLHDERYIRKRAALIVESLVAYYDAMHKGDTEGITTHLDEFYKLLSEINTSNYPDVDHILQVALSQLVAANPDAARARA